MSEVTKLPDPKIPLKINVRFAWKSCTPDARQWKPSMPVLEPMDIQVVVEVPLERDYVLNKEDLLTWQIGSGNGKMPDIKLTPAGMRFCIDALEQSMSPQSVTQVKEGETTKEDDFDDFDDFDDWDKENRKIIDPVRDAKPKTKKKTETKKVPSLEKEVLPDNEWKDFDENEETSTDKTESDFDFDN